jgi:hypothetical protein
LQDDIEVKYVSPEIGKGLFAKRDLEEDEIILVENPFVVSIVPPAVCHKRTIIFEHRSNDFFSKSIELKDPLAIIA